MVEGNERFISLNDFFSYGINGDDAHVHMPKKIGSLINEKGKEYAEAVVNEKLYDALKQILDLSKKDSRIKNVFVVSPLLSTYFVREMLKLYGFEIEHAAQELRSRFPNCNNLYQGLVSIEKLEQVLDLERETREDMEKYPEFSHGRLLYYKYERLKELGIIKDSETVSKKGEGITLEKVVQMSLNSYSLRKGFPIESKHGLGGNILEHGEDKSY